MIIPYPRKCFMMDNEARIIHAALNRIIVGRVFTVEDQISATLDAKAKM